MQPFEAIINFERVLEVFGGWPGFHDGEVHRVILDRTRTRPDGTYYPSIKLLVRGRNMMSEVNGGDEA